MTPLLYRLGRAAARRRRLTVAAWVLVAVLTLVVAQASGGELSDAFEVEGTESQQAADVLTEDFPAVAGTSAQVVFGTDGGSLADPEAAAAVDTALAEVAGQDHVGQVGDLQVSDDGTVGYADVQYTEPSEEIRADAFSALEETAQATNADGVVHMELGGELPTEAEAEEPGGQEAIGLLVAVVVLFVAFGSFVAMGLPIGTALVGILVSMGLITAIASVTEIMTFSSTLAAMIGLGVGIDYALFIVTRHRENLHAGMTVEESAGRAIATSGAAVLFAGMTVIIAISGLAIAGMQMVTLMGLMSALTVAVMVAISLTLLPALLGFAGQRLARVRFRRNRLAADGTARETTWHRWGRQVSAHPWRYLSLGVLVLGLLTAPLFGLRLGMPDNGTNPDDMSTRRAYDLLSDGFGPGFNGPLLLSVEMGDAGEDDLTPLVQALDPVDGPGDGVDLVIPPEVNEQGSAAVIRVVPTTAPQDGATSELIHHLRDDVIPQATAGSGIEAVHVGGQTAIFIDLTEKVETRLAPFFLAVLALSILLLMAVFRSIAVPLKAAAMNLLSIGAAMGVIVAVFQWGWLKDLVGLEETLPIVSFMPMMLFAVLFGLSMDYEVFLLSRVREEYLEGRSNDQAVVEGLSATARVITSAALIMISVFAAFALGDDPIAKMFGIGLATAVLVDATVVRIVLVPATMRLLGDRNWWLPGWLDRLLPRLDIEGTRGLPAPEYVGDQDGDRPRDREPVLVDA
jgi:putative drug exporter of the RND superfamily